MSPSPLALVTGGTGFIGSHMVDGLLARGWRVRCLVRDADRARTLAALPVELAPGDLSDEAALLGAVRGADYVFHIAGVTKARHASEFVAANALGTERVFRACASDGGIKRVLLVSSLAAAGAARTGRPLVEDDASAPVSQYGKSKLAAEEIARSWGKRVPFTTVRPPTVYGPRDADTLVVFRLVAAGIRPVLGRRLQLSLIHVTDLVAGMLEAAVSRRAANRTYYLSGQDAELQQVIDLIASALGVRPRGVYVPLPVLELAARALETTARAVRAQTVLSRDKVQELRQCAWLCNSARAREELGFKARVGLEDGIGATAAWYRGAGWLPTAAPMRGPFLAR